MATLAIIVFALTKHGLESRAVKFIKKIIILKSFTKNFSGKIFTM